MADLEQIAQQQEYYLSLLPGVRERYGNITGVDLIGLGAKERNGRVTGEWAWRFYVRAKKPLHQLLLHEQIPVEIDGVQTDVLVHFEKEMLVGANRINDINEYRDHRVLGGTPIRNEYFGSDTNSGYGTLGVLGRVIGSNQLIGLTCAHVVNAAADSMNQTGLKIGQPRYWVSCCCCPKGKIGTVSTTAHYSDTTVTQDLDCALITIDSDIAERLYTDDLVNTREHKILGHNSETDETTITNSLITISGARSIMCFEVVRKRGQGTGLTSGKVVDVAYGGNQMLIKNADEVLTDPDDPNSAIEPNSLPFASHGDSGAVLIGTDNKVLGMIIAASRGSMQRTIATHIKPIMQKLNIKIGGTEFNAMGEPVGGGPNGCEIKIWPGGQSNPDLNPPEQFESTQLYTSGGSINWEVLGGPGGALIVWRDGNPITPGVTTVTGATQIRVRYGTVSPTASPTDAIQIKGTRGAERPATVFRTVFSITPQPINTTGALNIANSKTFIGADTRTAGVEFPGVSGTRYLAKAEIQYNVLPSDIDWNSGIISFVTGTPADTLGFIRSQRETKFCRGEQATGAANRTHTDQATWISAGASTVDDFQPPASATRDKIFRIANKGFNPVIESRDINHDTYNPDTYLQRYVRANYRDRLEFYNGTAWVPLTDYTLWSVNFTAALTAALPHTAPPTPGAAADNIIEAGENTAPLPNTQPVIDAIATQEVRPGQTNVTLTAVPSDADADVLTDLPNPPAPPPPARPAVHWVQSPAAPAIVLTANPANPRNSVRFTAPMVERQFTFTATTNDNTAGLSRAPAVPAAPAIPNFQSQPVNALIDVVEWKNIGGGHPNTSRNMTEVFTAAAFNLGAATLDFNVANGGIAAVIIEVNGAPVAPTGAVVGAASIRVRYDTRSGDLTRGQSVRIEARNSASGATWFKRRTVFRIIVAVHASDGAPPHTHLIPSTLGVNGQDHFCTAQGQGNSVLQAITILPAPDPNDISWNAGAFPFTCPSVGADRTTAHISSNTGTGQDIPFSVRINGDVCYNGRYWTIWSATATAPRPLALTLHASSFEVAGGFNFTFTIQPAAIITDVDRPNLSGAFTVAPPNVTAGDVSVYQSARNFAGGANARWDSTRRARQRVLNPNGVVWRAGVNPDFRTTFLNFPSNALVGNDDTHTGDPEDNNPYTAPGLGALLGTDFVRDNMNDSEGNDGDTVEIRFHCQEFARLEMGGTWYIISPDINWRIHMMWIKTAGRWGDNGSLIDLTNAGF